MNRQFKLIFWAACSALLLAWITPNVGAQTAKPSGKMAFQGFITDSSGVARGQATPQNFTITFRLYKTATGLPATAIWAESQVVTVDKGHFSVILGEGNSVPGTTGGADLSGFFVGADASDRYLGIQVGTEAEVAPRIQFLPAPYAQLARYATELVGVNGSSVLKAGAGGIGINVVGQPAAALDVNGAIKALSFSGDGSNLTSLSGAALRDISVPDSKLISITTTGKVANSATTAASANKANAIVLRDQNGSFSANVLTASNLISTTITVDTLTSTNLSAKTLFVNGALGVSDGTSRILQGGIGTEVNSELINFGLNDTRVGTPNFANQGGIFRVDGRAGFPLFTFNARAAGAQQNALANVMSITSAGNVGVGTTSPTQAKLVVIGSGGSRGSHPTSGYNGTLVGGQTGTGQAVTYLRTDNINANSPNSIYAEAYVQALVFVAFSDERMKNIKGRSDGATDLSTLMGIEITDYQYKDQIAKGSGQYKKVIAQQVERVYPQAVNKQTDVVPDIYKAAAFKDGWAELATDLKKGDRVRLIGKGDHQEVVEVLEVGKDRFRTSFNPGAERVFVYGREVNDFRTVDYEAISMLNVSATQQIKKEKDAEVKALREENSALRSRVENLEARDKSRTAALDEVATMREELATLKKMVAQMAAIRNVPSGTTVAAIAEGRTESAR